jgi:hypothetical protein
MLGDRIIPHRSILIYLQSEGRSRIRLQVNHISIVTKGAKDTDLLPTHLQRILRNMAL